MVKQNFVVLLKFISTAKFIGYSNNKLYLQADIYGLYEINACKTEATVLKYIPASAVLIFFEVVPLM